MYNLENGILKDLGLHMEKLEDVPEEYRLAKIKKLWDFISINSNLS